MPYKDMQLTCRACGTSFFFTAGEQEFYADKGFLHEPTRCPRCRAGRAAPTDRAAQEPTERNSDNRPRTRRS